MRAQNFLGVFAAEGIDAGDDPAAGRIGAMDINALAIHRGGRLAQILFDISHVRPKGRRIDFLENL